MEPETYPDDVADNVVDMTAAQAGYAETAKTADAPEAPSVDLPDTIKTLLLDLKALDKRIEALSEPVVKQIGHHAVAQVEQVRAGIGHAFGNLAHVYAHACTQD